MGKLITAILLFCFAQPGMPASFCGEGLRQLYSDLHLKKTMEDRALPFRDVHPRLRPLFEALEKLGVSPLAGEEFSQQALSLTLQYEKHLTQLGFKAKTYVRQGEGSWQAYAESFFKQRGQSLEAHIVLFPSTVTNDAGGMKARYARIIKGIWDHGHAPVVDLMAYLDDSLGYVWPEMGRVALHPYLLNDLVASAPSGGVRSAKLLRPTNIHEQIHLHFHHLAEQGRSNLLSTKIGHPRLLPIDAKAHPMGDDFINYSSYQNYFNLEEIYTHLTDAAFLLERSSTSEALARVGLALNFMERFLYALDNLPRLNALAPQDFRLVKHTRYLLSPEDFPQTGRAVVSYGMKFKGKDQTWIEMRVNDLEKIRGPWQDLGSNISIGLAEAGINDRRQDQMVAEFAVSMKEIDGTFSQNMRSLRGLFLEIKRVPAKASKQRLHSLGLEVRKAAKDMVQRLK